MLQNTKEVARLIIMSILDPLTYVNENIMGFKMDEQWYLPFTLLGL